MHDILKTAVEAAAEAMDEPLRNGGIVSTQAAAEIALRAALPGILEAVVGVAEQRATNIRGMADYTTGIPPIAAAVDSLAAAQRALVAEILENE